MKKLPVLLLLLVTFFSGCKDEEEPVKKIEDQFFSFDIKHEKPFLVPMADANGIYDLQALNLPLVYPIKGVNSTTEADLQKNNTTLGLVKNIVLKELLLTMPDNSAEDFTFLEKMDIYIAMEDESEQLLMAYNRNVPTTPGLKKVVFLPVAGAPMDKYIKSGKYTMILKDTKLRRKVTADLNMTVRMIYSVTASPLK